MEQINIIEGLSPLSEIQDENMEDDEIDLNDLDEGMLEMSVFQSQIP